MEEFLLHLEYVKLIGYVAVFSIVITFITYLIFKKYRLVKYIPGTIFLALGLYSIYTINSDLSSPEGLNKIVVFLIGFGGGIVSLLTGLILGVYNKEKKVKKNKKSNDKDEP